MAATSKADTHRAHSKQGYTVTQPRGGAPGRGGAGHPLRAANTNTRRLQPRAGRGGVTKGGKARPARGAPRAVFAFGKVGLLPQDVAGRVPPHPHVRRRTNARPAPGKAPIRTSLLYLSFPRPRATGILISTRPWRRGTARLLCLSRRGRPRDGRAGACSESPRWPQGPPSLSRALAGPKPGPELDSTRAALYRRGAGALASLLFCRYPPPSVATRRHGAPLAGVPGMETDPAGRNRDARRRRRRTANQRTSRSAAERYGNRSVTRARGGAGRRRHAPCERGRKAIRSPCTGSFTRRSLVRCPAARRGRDVLLDSSCRIKHSAQILNSSPLMASTSNRSKKISVTGNPLISGF